MPQDDDRKRKAADLRSRAEKKLQKRFPATRELSNFTCEEIESVVHELTVHQIELEVQSEELRRTQTELEKLKDRYLDLYEFAPVGYVTVGEGGLITQANLTVCRLLGVERSSLVNRPFSRFVYKDDQDAFYLFLNELFESRSHQKYEIRLAENDGKSFYAQLDCVVRTADEDKSNQCRMTISNISDRKKAEERLVESETRLMEAERIARSGNWDWDARTNKVYWSLGTYRIFEVKPDEFAPDYESHLKFVLPEERGEYEKTIRHCLESKKEFEYEMRIVTPSGKIRNLAVRGYVKLDDEGVPTGMVGTCQDISERKEMERMLLEAQKMEAVGTLAGGIAHDFNNLLQIISGNAELLELELAQKEIRFREMEAILQSARRGADLVKQILTFSRKVDTNFEIINLNDDVKNAERLLYRTIPKMIQIELMLENKLKLVQADSTQVEQILINLVVNSRDAMPQGGRLTVKTQNVQVENQYCKGCGRHFTGQYVLLQVSDTGQGMSEDVLNHIFEPFFTTKRVAEGTGLGLATVFGIVKMHRGHIICESEVGNGTTFSIYFPAIEEAVPDIGEKQQAAPIAGGTETILVVDDEPLISELATRILTGAGYSVLTAGSGKEALDAYAQQKSDIALVILDLIMPEMGGEQCLKELLKIDPQVKALIASGFAVSGDTKAFIDTEAKGKVAKPFHMRDLLRSVRHVLDGA